MDFPLCQHLPQCISILNLRGLNFQPLTFFEKSIHWSMNLLWSRGKLSPSHLYSLNLEHTECSWLWTYSHQDFLKNVIIVELFIKVTYRCLHIFQVIASLISNLQLSWEAEARRRGVERAPWIIHYNICLIFITLCYSQDPAKSRNFLCF